jgi:hypothetical protein
MKFCLHIVVKAVFGKENDASCVEQFAKDGTKTR